MQGLSIYIHYPFCVLKCPYCDFNSHVREEVDHTEFTDAYIKELEFFARKLGKRKIKTIFFGGGTPSLMPESLVAEILLIIEKLFYLDKRAEITLEANPSSVENKKLAHFKKSGVNRISLGIQSLRDNNLKFLGRAHNSADAKAAIEIAANLFRSFSLDFIYALPKQTISEWEEDLDKIFTYKPNHLSLYQLTIEKGTKFFKEYKQQKFILPKDELAAEMYEFTTEKCLVNGLNAYEVSNYAKPNYESKHNLNYWRYGEYLGVGAGAHSRVKFKDNESLKSLVNYHQPEKWLTQIQENNQAILKQEEMLESEVRVEKIMMGLRLQEGINLNDLNISEVKLSHLIKENFIEKSGSNIRASAKGFLLLNTIIAELIL